MKALDLQLGDLLETKTDGLIVPIDGTIAPSSGTFERLLGNIGRQFNRRFPEADFLEELESQLDLPLALGRAADVELIGGPFRHVIVVSTLHHAEMFEPSAKLALVRDSLKASLDIAGLIGIQTLGTAVLQGGWRLTPETAFSAMLSALHETTRSPPLVVHCLEPELYERLRQVARSFGFLKGRA